MALPMFGQTMGESSLNQIATLNSIANSFIILIRSSIRRQILSYEYFGGLLYMLGAL